MSAALVLLVGCGLFEAAQSDTPPRSAPARKAAWFAQTGYVAAARFVPCARTSCPSITAKVIESAPTAAQAAPMSRAQRVGVSPSVQVEPPTSYTPSPKALPGAIDTQATAPRSVTLHFATGSARLTEDHREQLRAVLDQLRQSRSVVISGRTDNVGSESANQALAFARGLAVRHQLLDLDPDLPARITVDARGRCCYAAANDSRVGRAKNRRVELSFGFATPEVP